MPKQAMPKGAGVQKRGLSAWKENKGLNVSVEKGKISGVSCADKNQEWIMMPEAFQDATRLPGIPQGYVVSVIGHTNTGKSTLINHAISSAMRQGLIPVIFDTENSFSFDYAVRMGMQAEPVYGKIDVEKTNEETGEISVVRENRIVDWDGEFLYFNNQKLADAYGQWNYKTGSEEKTKRTVAVIEDIAKCITELLDAQDRGEIDKGFLFIWDSVGSITSYKAVTCVGNNMYDANAISVAFNSIINDRIPRSRKVNNPYTNTFLFINKIWLDPTTSPTGPIMQTKGGKSLKYAVRLEILMGGQLTSGVKRLTASFKGLDYSYGTETKIKIMKNHLNAPHNVCYEGKMIASDTGFIRPEELDKYKKEHISDIIKQLQVLSDNKYGDIRESDITFGEKVEEEIPDEDKFSVTTDDDK